MARFAVLVSEKGGAERRELFDQPEITVGRVQGNEVLLARGNVSKRHARVLYRDGRFIVTDLKSTNGTYVNGRRITQATIVRDGDKIFIGDFVLRVEVLDSVAAGAPVDVALAGTVPSDLPALDPPPSERGAAQVRPVVTAPTAAPRSIPAAPPLPQLPQPPQLPKLSAPRAPATIAVRSAPPLQAPSHFPLEHDPDEAAAAASSSRVSPEGQAWLPGARPMAPGSPSDAGPSLPLPMGKVPPLRPSSSASPGSPVGPAAKGIESTPSGAPDDRRNSGGVGQLTPRRRGTLDRPERADPLRVAAVRSSVKRVVDEVALRVDLTPFDDGAPVAEAVQQQLDEALQSSVEVVGVDLLQTIPVEVLLAHARRELVGLGPFETLLDDEDVTEVQVVRHDYVVVTHGRRQSAADVAFTSERALLRAVRRLCWEAGHPLGEGDPVHGAGAWSHMFVARRLARSGARMNAVIRGGVEGGHLVVVRKPSRADLTLDDLVRNDTLTRSASAFLAQAVAARANVLVVGSHDSQPSVLVGALAAAGSIEDRVVLLQEDDEIALNQPHAFSFLLGADPAEAVQAVAAAATMRADRVVAGVFSGVVAAELLDAMGHGMQGVLAAVRAPTLRHALGRLPADIAAVRGATYGTELVREWLAVGFDLVVELARMRDGRTRVLRVAELAIDGKELRARDIFTVLPSASQPGEGSLQPTGLVPALASELATRGHGVDSGLFRVSVPAGRSA
jgi:pilus assembly protein CpaF